MLQSLGDFREVDFGEKGRFGCWPHRRRSGEAQQAEELQLRSERNLWGLQILGINLTSRAHQDDTGDAFTLDALNVPTGAHGLFDMRQAVITIPASSLAG